MDSVCLELHGSQSESKLLTQPNLVSSELQLQNVTSDPHHNASSTRHITYYNLRDRVQKLFVMDISWSSVFRLILFDTCHMCVHSFTPVASETVETEHSVIFMTPAPRWAANTPNDVEHSVCPYDWTSMGRIDLTCDGDDVRVPVPTPTKVDVGGSSKGSSLLVLY